MRHPVFQTTLISLFFWKLGGLWWDCIALPDDIDSSDEASFRMQIKELAFESLQLLQTAIFDKE
ncbi:histone-lysine N-methyltransferase ATXR2-like, partial [Trifolium medium]|nr:histone-lysine N-methyltransferase ATXR2-like [Trifolium medium]